ncbi:MAG: fluoride efflux transporter CrcB [Deltaproteobacteria bacterium HGW-Deltaproteobacteria-24]|jgi:CrcB protein|nr:MAG: fluoride efflux transporter CrcB [Deltaproteobacteria bacterium HGW-Deltaproteobacteria-24]
MTTLYWQTLLAVGCGGFLGAISRVYINHTITKMFPSEFPYGILIINVVGSFFIGVMFALFLHYNFSQNAKAFITSGFLGALTTYSTFAIESFFLLQSSFILGVSNMFFNLFGSVAAAAIGYKLLLFIIR